MKKGGVLNSRLSAVIAEMGHTDYLVVADSGLPVPVGIERIDLAVSVGVPSFSQVLNAVASELQVEQIVIASEARSMNPAAVAGIEHRFPDLSVRMVSHEEFKLLTRGARAIVRTGECTPYANAILYSGVIF